MRHYEIVVVIHPDQSERVGAMCDRYQETVRNGGGQVHRFENWGARRLAYPVRKLLKAHYVLFNIECENDTLRELEESFRFSDAVLRTLVVKRKTAESEDSAVIAHQKRQDLAAEEAKAAKSAAAAEKPAPAATAATPAASATPAARSDSKPDSGAKPKAKTQ